MKFVVYSIVGLGCLIALVSGDGWSYEGQSASHDWSYEGKSAPKTWRKKYPNCAGRAQSPINIEGEIIDVPHDKLHPMWLEYNVLPESMTMTNNGHTLSLNSNEESKPHIEIGKNKTYLLDTIHFHWGKRNSEGSEHTIRGKRYPLEMHVVHKRVFNGVVLDPPEVIVVAVLFEISKLHRNPGLDKFLSYLPIVRSAETSIPIKPFKWSALIPQFSSRFYVYRGSLTTPPCSEVATFFIREHIEKMSADQMEVFRLLLDDDGFDLSGNFRPIQQENERKILFVRP